MWLELVFEAARVERVDVGVGDDGVPVRRRQISRERSRPVKKSGLDPDDARSEPDLTGERAYQVTSPAPVRTFATRASMKRRSDRRLR